MATIQFNYPIYDYSVGWFNHQPESPLEFIAPAQPVGGVHGTLKRYPQGWAFRALETLRAKNTPANAIEIDAEDVPFLLEDHSLRIGVDDTELAPGAGSNADAAEQLAQAKINSLLTTWRTSAIVDGLRYFRNAVPVTSGKGNWSAAAADPLAELEAVFGEFETTNGIIPNRMLLSRAAWNTLCNNAEILDRVAYNNAKVLTPELLVKLLKLDPSALSIKVASIPVGAAKPAPGAPFTGTNALANDCWLTYVDDGQLVGNLTGMRTLHAGGSAPVESVESYYERAERTTWYEVNMHRAFMVTAPSCNVRLEIS